MSYLIRNLLIKIQLYYSSKVHKYIIQISIDALICFMGNSNIAIIYWSDTTLGELIDFHKAIMSGDLKHRSFVYWKCTAHKLQEEYAK